MLADWNRVRESIVLSSGYDLDLYGHKWGLKRIGLESCADFRKRVLYVFDININYLMGG